MEEGEEIEGRRPMEGEREGLATGVGAAGTPFTAASRDPKEIRRCKMRMGEENSPKEGDRARDSPEGEGVAVLKLFESRRTGPSG